MKKAILIIFNILIMSNIMAQSIKGTIKNQAGEGISSASVAVLNTSKGVLCDKSGNFEIALPKGKYDVSVSALGYATQIKSVEIEGQKIIDFTLADGAQDLDEIVVTADKIETNLQKTPLAITALNAKKITEYRVWNFTDLTALAPSAYTVEHGNTTGSNFLNFRGAMGFTNEQAVATYVDGVYQFDFFSAPMNFNNIERVEILRGPQGTLYGRNAFSGVLNVITKRPSNITSGYASIDVGNYGQQRYSIGYNTALVKNKLFMGLGLQQNKRGSLYENPTLKTKNYDSRTGLNGNLGLKYLASSKWIIDLNARAEKNDDKGGYPWVGTDSIARNHPYKTYGNYTNEEKRTNFNSSVGIKYFGNKFNFTSITGYVNYYIDIPDKFDFDFSASKLVSGTTWSRQNQVTQELRFSSVANSTKLKWTLGTFIFAEKSKNSNTTFIEEDYALFDPNAPYSSITNGRRNSKGIAFFGQATYAITPKFDITFGTRYDTENRALTQNSAFEKSDVVVPLAADSTVSKTFTAFTPKAILNYKIAENSMIYVSYAKGFRIGGFNFSSTINPTYNPEKSDNYEMGLKNTFLNNKLKVNLTAFYFQQKDQQVSTSKDGINYATLNVGDMNNFGLEAEVSAIPVKNLQVEWTASTSNSDYTTLKLFDAATLAVKDFKGNKAIYNPAIQSMLALQYNIPVGKGSAAFVRLEDRYVGEYQLNFENTESQKAYNMINTRAGVSSKHFDVALWVRNLNDVRYMAWGTYATYMLGSPRMMGVTLTGKF